jgi:hypothetical protein
VARLFIREADHAERSVASSDLSTPSRSQTKSTLGHLVQTLFGVQ